LEYIAGIWITAEKSPWLAMADTVRATCGGEVEETVVSYLFVRYFCLPYKCVDFIRLLLMRSPCCISLPGLSASKQKKGSAPVAWVLGTDSTFPEDQDQRAYGDWWWRNWWFRRL